MNDRILENSIRIVRNMMEDAPANAVGGGNIAGLGVGPQGEPPGIPASKKKKKKRNIKSPRSFWIDRI
tara:strand:- start:321 stop:524 length:204 start_codon:yes stop_codon:yes gene_type:complete